MSMLLDLKNNELFQEVVSLDAVHNATIKSFETHRDLTSMLRDQIGPNSEVDGEGFIIDDEHIRAAQHLIVSINKLVTELRTQCAADAATSFAALKAFTTLINDSFDLSLSVELKEPAHVAE
jgi:argonaute-like protein implicated in RNA metabolism and viral defense